ncbi:MAG: FAD-dependent oxidoreductase [Nanobdellota archaeon]
MRIGVFLCQCRGEISQSLDLEALAESAKQHEDVTYVETHTALCSSSSYGELKRTIKNQNIDRVVIAACSPKYYEDIFRKTIEAAGLNPGYLAMANVREQCAWPHRHQPKECINKAKLILEGAIEKVKLSQPINLEQSSVKKSVLVVGGGIAGIHAALSLAEQGLEVQLVEKRAVIGGDQVRFAKAFPRDECSPCAFAPIITRLVHNDNIRVHTLSEVMEVGGRVGEYSVTIQKNPRYVDESKCTNCGDCTTVCPLNVENPYEFNLANHRRIHLPYDEAHPHCRVVEPSTIEDCRKNCHRYCEKICSVEAVNLDAQPHQEKFTVGGVIIATGYKLYEPTEFHYNESKNVVTLAEYERIVAPDGVTEGQIQRLSDKKAPRSIAFILCVGSRDPQTNPYCSKYCCMASATLISQTKEKLPEAKIYVFYKDIQTVGKMGDDYVRRTQEAEGVEWIRAIPTSSRIIDDERISLRVDANGGLLDIDVDMVVLANGMEPSKGADELRKVVGLDKNEDGFYREADIMLNPVSTFDPGKYICGTCVGPKAIAETITEARSAAASCASVLGSEQITQEVLVSKVNEELCGNCKICLRTCPFGAVTIDENKHVSITDNTLCRGCGNCVSACPSGARDLIMYPNDYYSKGIDILSKFDTDDPRILVFACNGCGYPAADQAAQIGGAYPPNVLIIRVPCAGRIDAQYIEYAFSKGFEGVFIGMCHIGSCHYVVGNEDLMKRMDLLVSLLEAKGVNKSRLKMSEISPTEGKKFIDEIHGFIHTVEGLREDGTNE